MHPSNEPWEKTEAAEGPDPPVDIHGHPDYLSTTLTEKSGQLETDIGVPPIPVTKKGKSQMPLHSSISSSQSNVAHARVRIFEFKSLRDQKPVRRHPRGFWDQFFHRQQGSDGKDLLQCINCDKIYKDRPSIKYHLLHVHNAAIALTCSFCPRKFLSSAFLKNHMAMHAEERSFACDFCGISFPHEQTLLRHQKCFCKSVDHWKAQEQNQSECPGSVSSGKFLCDRCGKSFKSVKDFKYHLLRVHSVGESFSCSLCARKFPYSYDLKRHMVMHTKEKSFLCDVCGISYSLKESLLAHQKYFCKSVDHREEQEQDQSKCPRPNSKQLFKCDRCDKSYKVGSGLRKHLLQAHSVGKSISCSLCPLKFLFSSDLRRHMAMHANKGWTCGNCGRGFKCERRLVQHERHGCPNRFQSQEQEFTGGGSRPGNTESNHEYVEAPENIVEEAEEIGTEQSPSAKTNKDQPECQEGAKRKRRVHKSNPDFVGADEPLDPSTLMEERRKDSQDFQFDEGICLRTHLNQDVESQDEIEANGKVALGLRIRPTSKSADQACQKPSSVPETKIHSQLYSVGARRIKGGRNAASEQKSRNTRPCPIVGESSKKFGNTRKKMKRHTLKNADLNQDSVQRLLNSVRKMDAFHQTTPAIIDVGENQETERRRPRGLWNEFLLRRQEPNGKDVFQCNICDQSYKSRVSLKYHLLHLHNVGKGLSCSFCPSKFINSARLMRHMARHTEEKSFLCNFCGTSFSFKDSFLRHQKYFCKAVDQREELKRKQPEFPRPGSKPLYRCDKCDQRFKHPNCLKYHLLRVHATGKNFSCSYCERKFVWRSHLKEHMVVHTEGGWSCGDCGKSFEWKQSLKTHQKNKCSMTLS